jgi:hypothetical protein
MYGASLKGLRIGRSVIYRGVFAAGMFQTLYQPGTAHWAMLPLSLEWMLATVLIGVLSLAVPEGWWVVGLMATLPVVVASLRASQASLPRRYDGIKARTLVAGLCLAQPVVRSWARYRTYFFPPRRYHKGEKSVRGSTLALSHGGHQVVGYWDATGRGRITLLDSFSKLLTKRLRPIRIDAGWSEWDFEVFPHSWTSLRIETVQEGEKACEGLFRIRYRLRPSGHSRGVAGVFLLLSFILLIVEPMAALIMVGGSIVLGAALWWRGLGLAQRVVSSIDEFVLGLGLLRCEVGPRKIPGGGVADVG